MTAHGDLGAPELSLVVPAFNEAARIDSALLAIERFAAGRSLEVLIVDDGSSDDTLQRVEQARPRFSGTLHAIGLPHRGKGHAVRYGVLSARGKIVAFSDADLSTPLNQLDTLTRAITSGGQDVVIGSRALDRTLVTKRQAWLRETLGKTFNVVARAALPLPFRDTQCGFKAFRREVARDVFGLSRIDGFAFDAEVLTIALERGYRVAEVAVPWRNDADSRVHVVLAPLQMLRDTARIAHYRRRGLYRRPTRPAP